MRTRPTLAAAALLAVVAVIGSAASPGRAQPSKGDITSAEARAISKEAYIYGFPLVDNYRVQYAYFVNRDDPECKGAWNQIHNTARVYTPDDKAIQSPNADTPYSMLGADLRAAQGPQPGGYSGSSAR
jgi:hypothetical protein